jgi:dihydrofolate synthase/folylpolyglutamate synthase
LAGNLLAHPARNKTYAVFALLADKDAAGVIAPLKESFDAWFVAGLEGARGQAGETLAAQVRAHVTSPVEAFLSPLCAFQSANLKAVEGDRIVVFGSFHTVAEVLPDATSNRR